MTARAANAYRRVDLESAPKTRILERLFERFLRDVETARGAIDRKDVSAKAAAIDHALLIVLELKAALDHAAGPAMCANLEALYDFVTDQLTEANIRLTTAPLDQARRVMSELDAAFREAHAR